MPPTYGELQLTVTFMFALLLIVSCIALDKGDGIPKRGPKAPVESCQLHRRPINECANQHDQGDPQ